MHWKNAVVSAHFFHIEFKNCVVERYELGLDVSLVRDFCDFKAGNI